MANAANDQAYIAKIKRLAQDYPERLDLEIHEAHYLLEQGVISEDAYQIVLSIAASIKKAK